MIIKVCGMREPENIRAVEALNIDWMGFICWHKSQRYVDEAPTYLPLCKRVGVFVNAEPSYIYNKVKQLQLTHIQLHGDESADYCTEIGEQTRLPIIKAISISSEEDLHKTSQYHGKVSYLLFDTKCKSRGGSGLQFDWSVLQKYQGPTPFLLSGGIGPNDVQELNEFKHPQCVGIDLNSRFEIAPARKDAELLKEFLSKVR